MRPIENNMQKHQNYTEQMRRLTRAINSEFYLEAIFIEYAVIEDRLESILRHSGKFNPEKHNKLVPKLNRLKEMCREKKGLAKKYFSDELLEQIAVWKDKRNPLIHALLKQQTTADELKQFAKEGQKLVKTLNNKVSCYNKKLAKLEERSCPNS